MTTARVNGTEVSEHSENPEERLEVRPVVVLSKKFPARPSSIPEFVTLCAGALPSRR
jgi:hypothetical protein